MPSRVFIFCALLQCSYVATKPVHSVQLQTPQLDNAKGGPDIAELPDGDHESPILPEHRRSVQQTTDRRIDDMLIGSGEMTTIEPGYTHTWPNMTIYYTFEGSLNFEYRRVIVEALNEWTIQTCIVFRLAERWQDHIIFLKSDDLGKGGVQIVSMTDDCLSKGHALHLVGHAIGLWHEHSRPDRDNYIDICYGNIIETEQESFGKLSQEQFNLVPDVGYDIESIMHYGPYQFSKNNRETIRLTEDTPFSYKHCTNLLSMGQREQLSYLDKLRVNKLYSCQKDIVALEATGRTCIPSPSPSLPTTTTEPPISTCESPITTSELSTAIPQSPTTAPDSPTTVPLKCPFSSLLPAFSIPGYMPFRLKTGSVITLQSSQDASKGMRCDPGCSLKECQQSSAQFVCPTIDFLFEIVAVERQDTRKIKSGDKVALRSRCNPSKWLDCGISGRSNNTECSITNCSGCEGSVCYNATFVTPCNNHHFTVFGIRRRDARLINTNHQLYFRSANDGRSVLSCYGESCKLSNGGNFTNRGETLDWAQRFSFTILTNV